VRKTRARVRRATLSRARSRASRAFVYEGRKVLRSSMGGMGRDPVEMENDRFADRANDTGPADRSAFGSLARARARARAGP